MGVYNLGSGEETSVKELAERIIKATGSKSEIVLNEKETERPFRFAMDITRARKDLGYSPRLLDEGLPVYLKELKERYER
jgi:nucleoside-diphosphate-sugar epimerase